MLRRILGLLAACLVFFTPNAIQASRRYLHDQFGAIRGRVLDPSGKPVAGASVYAKTTAPSASGMFATKSDRLGAFFFREAPTGEYRVYATTDDTDISHGFFNSPPWTINVLVREAQVTRGVTVRLYPNVATLLGIAQDKITGVRVVNPRMVLHSHDNPKRWISIGTNLPDYRFRILVPDIPLIIKVSADGYEDWYYGSDGTKEHAEVLQLAPGTTKELAIPLRKP